MSNMLSNMLSNMPNNEKPNFAVGWDLSVFAAPEIKGNP